MCVTRTKIFKTFYAAVVNHRPVPRVPLGTRRSVVTSGYTGPTELNWPIPNHRFSGWNPLLPGVHAQPLSLPEQSLIYLSRKHICTLSLALAGTLIGKRDGSEPEELPDPLLRHGPTPLSRTQTRRRRL